MRAIGAWTGTLSIAAASGPVVGGWLVGYNWRWVFWVSVPLCVAVIVLAARYLPETRNPAASHSVDIPGALLCAVGLAGVTYALIAWPGHGLGALTIVSGIGGAPVLAAFVVTESRARHPMLPTSLFASRIFSVINMVIFAVYAALSGAVLFLVLVLQVIAGWTALQAGASILPSSPLMLLLASRFAGVAIRIGARPLMVCGCLTTATGFVLLSLSPSNPSCVQNVQPGVTLLGFGLAMTVAPLIGTVLAAAPTSGPGRRAGRQSGGTNGRGDGRCRAAGDRRTERQPVRRPDQPRARLSDGAAGLCRGNRGRGRADDGRTVGDSRNASSSGLTSSGAQLNESRKAFS
jgi:hypothetical protein